MPAEPTCSECGAPLPDHAPGRGCPACLLRLALHDTPSSAEGGGPSAEPQDCQPESRNSFGDYELLKEIARGGMGVVYRARQLSLNRTVAVKMILAGQFASEADVQRFRAEAAAAADLQHPNIVAIHEVGEHNGQHYFSMDYVEGSSLADVVQGQPLSPTRAAGYLKTVGEAIHYAHQRGILHRDLKPSNVLLDPFDQPRITDFGLAKRLTSNSEMALRTSGLTATGQVLGSPNFMPPEQAGARRGQVGPHSDIYALGAILYHMLAGRPPFLAETLAETLQQVQNTEPVSPRLLNPGVPRDLETICLKCLEKDPRRRYGSARELSDDLGRFLKNEPVRARPVGPAGKAWRWCQRKPTLALSLLIIFILFLIVSIGSPIAVVRINHERHRAEQNAKNEERERRRAEQHAAESRARLVRQYVANGNRLVEGNDLLAALPWFGEALKLEQDDPARAQLQRLRLAATLQQCPKLLQVWFHQDTINFAEFSPDGRWVVTACDDQAARIWDATSGELVGPPLAHAARVLGAAFSPDGRSVATACADGTARVWNPTNAQPLTSWLKHDGPVLRVAFNADGSRIVTASEDATARVWNTQTGEPVAILKHLRAVRHAAFSPDASLVVTASDDRTARVWNAATGQPVGHRMTHEFPVRLAEFSPDGGWVLTINGQATLLWDRTNQVRQVIEEAHRVDYATFSPDGKCVLTASSYSARLYDATTARPNSSHMEHDGRVVHGAFSPDGRLAATASGDGTVRIWDGRWGKPRAVPLRHTSPVRLASFSPDGHRVLTVCDDQVVRIWDLAGSVPATPMLHPSAVVSCTALSPDGRLAATVSIDGKVALWDLSSGERVGPMLTNIPNVRCAQFSPLGGLLAIGGDEGQAQSAHAEFAHKHRRGLALVLDTTTWKPVSPLLGHNGPVNSLQFNPAGTRLATGDSHRAAGVWDLQQRRVVCNMEPSNAVYEVAWTPDGKELITASQNSPTALAVSHSFLRYPADSVHVCRWDAQTGQLLSPPVKLPVRATQVTFSDDRRRLVTASQDERQTWVWDVLTGRRLSARPLQHGEGISSANFSPEGRRVVTASLDQTARVWDALTGQALTPPMEHREGVSCAVFSPDGRLVVTASYDETARLWDAATGEAVTPPLPQDGKLNSVLITQDGRRLLTTQDEPMAQVWDLPRDTHSMDDLRGLAQLLSGHEIEATTGRAVLSPEALQSLWRQRPLMRSDDFQAQPRQVQLWRQRVAEAEQQIESLLCKMHGARLMKDNDYAGALIEFSKAVALRPGDSDGYWQRATAYFQLKEPEQAAADARKVIELNPNFAPAYHALAAMYVSGPTNLRSASKALPLAQRAVELLPHSGVLAPRSQEYSHTLGVAYYQLRNYAKAIETLERPVPIEDPPLQINSWLYLALSYQRLDQPTRAAEYRAKVKQWLDSKDAAKLSDRERASFEAWLKDAERAASRNPAAP